MVGEVTAGGDGGGQRREATKGGENAGGHGVDVPRRALVHVCPVAAAAI
jgi:hypothetical protein